MDIIDISVAKKYTDDSISGISGTLAGKNCKIQSITDITDGKRVTFAWTDDGGTSRTSTMDVMNGEVGEDGLGIKSVDINAQNHLIVTYDDDTTHDAGEIHGGTGEVISVNGKKGVVTLDASDVGALADDTEIPTKTSDLTNDDGFITKVVNDLTNYYTKSTTYTKTEVNDLINALSTLTLDIVETLPVSDISTTTIYLTPVSGQQNVYMQYIYVNNEWAQLGTTQADLSNYYTKTQMDASLLLKQDALTFDSAPTAGSINPVTSGGVYTALQNVDVPVATTQTAGKVKPDGTTITVDSNGVISGANTLEGGNLISIDDDAINADIFVGTNAEWSALSSAEKAKYTLVNITDDSETGETVDAVTNGDMRAVTSNAVFDAINPSFYRLITESTAGNTYKAQLLELMTEYNKLSVTEKMRSAIVEGDAWILTQNDFRTLTTNNYGSWQIVFAGSEGLNLRGFRVNGSTVYSYGVKIQLTGSNTTVTQTNMNDVAYSLSLKLIVLNY